MRYFIYHSAAKSQKREPAAVAKSQSREIQVESTVVFTLLCVYILFFFWGFCSVLAYIFCDAMGLQCRRAWGFTWLQNKLIQNQPATSHQRGEERYKKSIANLGKMSSPLVSVSSASCLLSFFFEVRLQPDLGTPSNNSTDDKYLHTLAGVWYPMLPMLNNSINFCHLIYHLWLLLHNNF